MSKKKKLTIEEIKNEYQELKPVLFQLNKRLVDVVEEILIEKDIKLGFPIKGRIKELDSLVTKVESGVVNVSKSIKEIQDLSGLRIILLFRRDIYRITELLSETFDVKAKYNTLDKLEDNQFGYSSIHYVVRVPNSWLSVPIYRDFAGFSTEIQIRTLSQHNWAEFSHILNYKSRHDVPKSINRSIGRVSALLEIVDLEFERLLVEMDGYNREQMDREKSELLDEKKLERILDELLPPEYKHGNESYKDPLKILKKGGIIDTFDLESIIKSYNKETILYDKRICQLIIDDNARNEFVNLQNIKYPTKRLEKIKKNMAYHNQIGMLNLLFKLRKQNIIDDK